jgi:hypothetical protein
MVPYILIRRKFLLNMKAFRFCGCRWVIFLLGVFVHWVPLDEDDDDDDCGWSRLTKRSF